MADLLASVLNQNVTAWRSGPTAAAIEQTVVGWLAGDALSGVLRASHGRRFVREPDGPSLAMAREVKVRGQRNRVGLQVYASSEIHMSIPKSVALLGIGRSNLRLIATDESSRMIPEELDATIVADKAAGKTPLAVVASGSQYRRH